MFLNDLTQQPMKFLADINIPQTVIIALNSLKHDVLDIKKLSLELKDTEIIKLAQREQRVILTKDKDFLTLTQFPKYQVATIAIRLFSQEPQHILDHLIELLQNQDEKILKSSITVISEETADSHLFI